MELPRLIPKGRTSESASCAQKTRNCQCPCSENVLVWILCGLYTMGNLGIVVSLPLYNSGTKMAGGSPFALMLHNSLMAPIIFFVIAVLYKYFCNASTPLAPASPWWMTWFAGTMCILTGLGVSITGLPERTPAHLQSIFVTMRIPYTVIIRLLWLRKGLSARRLVCTVILLMGIFISLEPRIWSLPGSDSKAVEEDAESFAGAQVVWPLFFSLSYLPITFVAVLCEREMKKEDGHPLNFVLWSHTYQAFMILPFFWVDILPYVGKSTSMAEVFSRIRKEMVCHFSWDESCYSLALKGWIYILSYCLANLLQLLVIQRAEGAVFAMIVQSVVLPLSTLFWTFFRFDEATNSLYWQPEFTVTTGFTLLGLVIIVPAVVMYNVFSRWDAQNDKAAAAVNSEKAVATVNGAEANGHCKDVNYDSLSMQISR